jgi:hypothetical protein
VIEGKQGEEILNRPGPPNSQEKDDVGVNWEFNTQLAD